MKEIEKYKKIDGTEPFSEWLEQLPEDVQVRVYAYVRRVANDGAKKNIEVIKGGNGVKEIRIHHGPGYRVYFGEVKNKVVLLLIGGTKRTQKKDIEKAKVYWRDYNATT